MFPRALRDHCYYGRSEYECKALPDHEVRLRMFRGQMPNATVQIAENHKGMLLVSAKDLKEALKDTEYKKSFNIDQFLKDTHFLEYMEKFKSGQPIPLNIHYFVLAVKNLGEIDITEFKLKVDFPDDNPFYLKSYSRTVKDGWLPRTGKTIGLTTAIAGRMQVNIYPQDVFNVQTHEFFCPLNYTPSMGTLRFKWTLYLSNTLPIQGSLDIPDFGVFYDVNLSKKELADYAQIQAQNHK